MSDYTVHPTADVSPQASIGAGTAIWHQAQVREGAKIGSKCIIGKDSYIDFGVSIGDNVKVQTGVQVYHGVTIEDGVFLGPGVILANDKNPRAINMDGSLKLDDDWEVGPIIVKYGAALGAGSIILPDVVVGRWALVGAGALVTRDVPDHVIVAGLPAQQVGYVCKCGFKLSETNEEGQSVWICARDDLRYEF